MLPEYVPECFAHCADVFHRYFKEKKNKSEKSVNPELGRLCTSSRPHSQLA
jgi:hypothetical protein